MNDILGLPSNLFFLLVGLALNGFTIASGFIPINDERLRKFLPIYRGTLGIISVVIASNVISLYSQDIQKELLILLWFGPMMGVAVYGSTQWNIIHGVNRFASLYMFSLAFAGVIGLVIWNEVIRNQVEDWQSILVVFLAAFILGMAPTVAVISLHKKQ